MHSLGISIWNTNRLPAHFIMKFDQKKKKKNPEVKLKTEYTKWKLSSGVSHPAKEK